MKIKLLFVLSLLISLNSFSQISLPKQFKCVLSKESFRENYFTDGTYKFKTDAWGNGVENAKDLQPYLEELYNHKLAFKKTKDGLAWGTGFSNSKYYYIVVIPERLTTVTLSSISNGSQFSNYSTWLLQQVRNNFSSGKDFYLTDFKGKECSSN
jgi:hypothetical protein